MGVIVGGAITMLGAWLKDRRDHRRAITRWVEDEFVFGSIEPVVRALDRLRLLLKQQEASVIPIGSVGDFPTAELARIRLVLGTDAVSVFLLNAGCYSKRAATETEGARIVASLVEEQQSQLWDLEKQLLGLDLGEKKDIFKIHKSNSINQIAKLADQVTERLLQIRV